MPMGNAFYYRSVAERSLGNVELMKRVENAVDYASRIGQTSAVVLLGDLYSSLKAVRPILENMGFKVVVTSDQSSIFISFEG